jgi:hypothetical protein
LHGLLGEYRKCSIGVSGSSTSRAHPEIFGFLCRIHTEFQDIHPFRGGNGRIGDTINHKLTSNEAWISYPRPSYIIEHYIQIWSFSSLGCKPGTFTRLLAEAKFASLQKYEKALTTGAKLLPTLGDLFDIGDVG